jgi:hypothetical protein
VLGDPDAAIYRRVAQQAELARAAVTAAAAVNFRSDVVRAACAGAVAADAQRRLALSGAGGKLTPPAAAVKARIWNNLG